MKNEKRGSFHGDESAERTDPGRAPERSVADSVRCAADGRAGGGVAFEQGGGGLLHLRIHLLLSADRGRRHPFVDGLGAEGMLRCRRRPGAVWGRCDHEPAAAAGSGGLLGNFCGGYILEQSAGFSAGEISDAGDESDLRGPGSGQWPAKLARGSIYARMAGAAGAGNGGCCAAVR